MKCQFSVDFEYSLTNNSYDSLTPAVGCQRLLDCQPQCEHYYIL